VSPVNSSQPVNKNPSNSRSPAVNATANNTNITNARRRSAIMHAAVLNVSTGLAAMTVASPATTSSFQPTLTRRAMKKIKQAREYNRRLSFSAIEGAYIPPGQNGEANNFSSSPHAAADSSTTPYFQRKVAVRVRRQSFPSLDNKAWKDSLSYQGLL